MNNDEVLLDPNLSDECDNVIEFSGTICEQARLDRMSRVNKIVGVLLAVFELIMLAALFVFVVYEIYDWVLQGVLCVVLGAVSLFLSFRPNKTERLCYPTYLELPITITITNEMVANSYFKKSLTTGVRPVEKVKKVIDVGDWYYIIFKFGDIGNSWVCQKDLLTKGTIDDFEKIFDGKIVRKTINFS